MQLCTTGLYDSYSAVIEGSYLLWQQRRFLGLSSSVRWRLVSVTGNITKLRRRGPLYNYSGVLTGQHSLAYRIFPVVGSGLVLLDIRLTKSTLENKFI